MQYRRLFIPGATYFFTVVTAHRRKLFEDKDAIEALRQAFRHVSCPQPGASGADGEKDMGHHHLRLGQENLKFTMRYVKFRLIGGEHNHA